MSNGSITDVGTSAAQAIGRYFSVVSVVPSSLYITLLYLLLASGSWQHPPNFGHAFSSLAHLGVTGIALLASASIALGVLIHPIQFALVQFFEGYWGANPIAQALRSQRILRYQRRYNRLNNQRRTARRKLTIWESSGIEVTLGVRAVLTSRYEEANRLKDYFPSSEELMPTRLGNVLRRAESLAGNQYKLNALTTVPHLMMIAPASQVAYVNDQRTQLDLAIRMAFTSALASVTTIFFLWPYGLWGLTAVIPYALSYVSYRGSVVAASHYGAALDVLISLNRFDLYKQMHLQLPVDSTEERHTNGRLMKLLNHSDIEILTYDNTLPPSSSEAVSE